RTKVAGQRYSPKRVLGHPQLHQPGRPANPAGQIEEPAAAGQEVLDAGDDPAGREPGERLRVRRRVEGRVIEQIVVAQEVEVDLEAGVPALEVQGDGLAPGRHERRVDVAVADPVDAQDRS